VRDGSDAAGGPAFESLQGRKPRDEGAPAPLLRSMAIWRAARLAARGLRRFAAGSLRHRDAAGRRPRCRDHERRACAV